MIPIDISVPKSLEYKTSELPSPLKPSLQIDFLELVNRSSSIRSTISTNDDYSVRTEDDSSKTFLNSEDFVFKASKPFCLPKINTIQPKTLQEIASKRKYTRRNLQTEADKSSQETIIKKRKLNMQSVNKTSNDNSLIQLPNQINDNNISNLQDNFPIPQVILKNGVVSVLDNSDNQQKDYIKSKPLEIIPNDQKKVVTSSSFKKSRHTEKWTQQETKKFYRALELFGTDFSMIAKLFQTRSRNQIKNKFLKEEKSSSDKINAAFSKTKNINFSQLINRFKEKTLSNNNNNNNAINKVEIQPSRSQRSGSFHSSVSLDSVDMSIMDDLADVFIPFSNKPLDTTKAIF